MKQFLHATVGANPPLQCQECPRFKMSDISPVRTGRAGTLPHTLYAS